MSNVSPLKTAERDLRAEVEEILAEDPELTQATAARQIGTSDTYLSRYLRGKSTGNVVELERKIAAWLESYRTRQAEARALPDAPGWVATPTAERIMATLEYAQIASDVVVIYGGAGNSKTETIRQYASQRPNVWCFTATQATCGVLAALEEIADALGMAAMSGPGGRPAVATLERAVMKRMRGTYGLLVVDEAQQLTTKTLDEMRQLHDATGVGLALVGNEQVYAGMTGGSRAPYLDRLFSRVGKKLKLDKPNAADIEKIISGWAIQASDCKKLLREIASKPGGLRILTKTLRLATMYAAGEDRTVCCADIRAAWSELGGVA